MRLFALEVGLVRIRQMDVGVMAGQEVLSVRIRLLLECEVVPVG